MLRAISASEVPAGRVQRHVAPQAQQGDGCRRYSEPDTVVSRPASNSINNTSSNHHHQHSPLHETAGPAGPEVPRPNLLAVYEEAANDSTTAGVADSDCQEEDADIYIRPEGACGELDLLGSSFGSPSLKATERPSHGQWQFIHAAGGFQCILQLLPIYVLLLSMQRLLLRTAHFSVRRPALRMNNKRKKPRRKRRHQMQRKTLT